MRSALRSSISQRLDLECFHDMLFCSSVYRIQNLYDCIDTADNRVILVYRKADCITAGKTIRVCQEDRRVTAFKLYTG